MICDSEWLIELHFLLELFSQVYLTINTVLTLTLKFWRHKEKKTYNFIVVMHKKNCDNFPNFLLFCSRGGEPICSDSLWVWGNQRPGELGSSSARGGSELLHRVLGPAQRRAPHGHGGPDAELNPADRPPTRHHVPGHSDRSVRVGKEEVDVCQNVHSRGWVLYKKSFRFEKCSYFNVSFVLLLNLGSIIVKVKSAL